MVNKSDELLDNRKIIEKLLLNNISEINSYENRQEMFNIIPELKDEFGFNQKNPWHIYDVWNHTVVALENSDCDIQTRLALLLHDIGKPHSYQEDGKIRHFKGHAQKSAEIAKNVLNRLGYDEKQVSNICFLIDKHSTVINVDNITEENIEMYKKLLHVQYCDTSAYNPEYTSPVFARLDNIKKKLK